LKPHSSAWVDCQFILALLVAALFSELTRKSTWTRFYRAFQVLLGIWKSSGKQAPVEVYEKRLATCSKCPLFYKPLATCSSPLKQDSKDLGCHCHLPTKARLAEARCWGDEFAGPDFAYGWEQANCG